MAEKIRLALIYGSTRQGRFCDTVAEWAEQRVIATGGFVVDIIDPALISDQAGGQNGRGISPAQISDRLASADAFLVVTPEYNHSFPAALKFLIDSVSEPWQAKPVAFVSYGGVSGGVRAVEQLRQVFAELHAVTVRNSVGFMNAWERFDDTGRLIDPERSERSMATMLEQLRWWARSLRDARSRMPYSGVA